MKKNIVLLLFLVTLLPAVASSQSAGGDSLSMVYPFDHFKAIMKTQPAGENYVFRTVPREFILNRLIAKEPKDSIIRLNNLWTNTLPSRMPMRSSFYKFKKDKPQNHKFRNADGTVSQKNYHSGYIMSMISILEDAEIRPFYQGKSNLLKLTLIVPDTAIYAKAEDVLSSYIFDELTRRLETKDCSLTCPELSIPIDFEREEIPFSEPRKVKKDYAAHDAYPREHLYNDGSIPVLHNLKPNLLHPFIFILSDTYTDVTLAIGVINRL